MRVRIDQNRCQGHAMCLLACSDLFALNDDDGHGYVLSEQVPVGLEESVDQARRSCPEQAILIDPA
jgi:ferredoxin